MTLALAACGAGSGEGLDQNGQPLSGGGGGLAPTLASIQANVFNVNCAVSGCHGGAAAQQLPFVNARTRHFEGETKLTGQFGYGLEIRFTRHIGWMSDFSWNVIDGPKNNFGMVRSGLTFAF